MNTKVLLWGILFGFVFVLSGAKAQAAQVQGRIIARGVKGTVTAREKAAPPGVNPVTVVNNMDLRQGMTITTGVNASVVLIFANGATVNLGTDSILHIDEFTMEPSNVPLNPDTVTQEPTVSKTTISLTKGELVGKVAKLNTAGGSDFTVGTPVGAAGIRGTTFRIVYRPPANGQATGTFTLTTIEGNVEIVFASAPAGAPPVAVGADQEVVLTNITITIDNVTGAVTISVPGVNNATAQPASAATTAAVIAVVQAIVEATSNISIPITGAVVVVDTPTPPKESVSKASDPQNKTTSKDGSP